MTRIIAAFFSLGVSMMLMASTADARVINKRAAFYIANDTMCIVDGEVYFNGDPVPTDDHCEKCTCRPPGFSCVLRDCEVKAGCKAVRKDGECCPDYICGCSHNGNIYKDGDFIRDLQNPCYTCRCHGSSISCTFADCLFRSDCGPEYVQGECCPRYDHCPPLSTTQKTTTIITTVPITYDETTMPLFNITSPPHDRLASHTTIFPKTSTVTAESGTETTVTYGTSFTPDSTETTHISDHTATTLEETLEPHTIKKETSTVTAPNLNKKTEEPSEAYETSTFTYVTPDETIPTSFTIYTTHLQTDVETGDSLKDASSVSTSEDVFSETITQLSEGEIQTDHTVPKHDESTSTPFSSESSSKTSSDITEKDKIESTSTRSIDDSTTTEADASAAVEDFKISSEEDVVQSSDVMPSSVTEDEKVSERATTTETHSTHETLSPVVEDEEVSKGTTPAEIQSSDETLSSLTEDGETTEGIATTTEQNKSHEELSAETENEETSEVNPTEKHSSLEEFSPESEDEETSEGTTPTEKHSSHEELSPESEDEETSEGTTPTQKHSSHEEFSPESEDEETSLR